MKLKIVGVVGTLMLLVLFLAACTKSENTDDTQETILSSVKPTVEKWFETNMADAEVISVESCGFFKKREFYDVVTGVYYKNSKQYCYWLNVDTEEFCSEEYYDILVQYIQEHLIESLTFDCKEVDIPLESAFIHGKDDYSTQCKWAYHSFSESELEDIADKEMSNGDKEIQMIVDAPDKIVADVTALDILKEHENWTFVLQEDRESLEYRIYYSEGKYYIARAFFDDKGIRQYEVQVVLDK